MEKDHMANVDKQIVAEILRRERERIAHRLVPAARQQSWCDEAMLAWRVCFGDDAPEPRDKNGVSFEGYKLDADGKTETNDKMGPIWRTRPVRPSLKHRRWAPSAGWLEGPDLPEYIELDDNGMPFDDDDNNHADRPF
jgi:hypothetical protein